MRNKLVRQMNVFSIVRDVLREWWVILILAVSVSLFTNIWVTAHYEPVYKTKIIFAVTTKGMNKNIYQNLTSAKELTTRFTQVLDSNVLKKKVTEDLGLEEFTAQTSAMQIPETNMVELDVSAGSAMDAYRILNSIMDNYDTVSDYVIGNVILEVIQPPSIPVSPSNYLDVKTAMVRSFWIGALLAALGFAWLSYMRDTIKSPEQLSEKIDAKLLGTIYREGNSLLPFMKRKAGRTSMLIKNPMRSFWFVESNKLLASRVRSYMERKNLKVLMVTSVTENEGKSTVASNLALSLAQEVKHVMLIDCDFRKPSLHEVFNLSDDMVVDLPEALKHGAGTESIVKQYEETNLYMVANSAAISSVESILESGSLQHLIEEYREQMDYIILDTAPMALVSDTEDLAWLADASLLVVREDTILAKHINDVVDRLNQTGGKVLGCVFNQASRELGKNAGGYGSYGRYYGKRTR